MKLFLIALLMHLSMLSYSETLTEDEMDLYECTVLTSNGLYGLAYVGAEPGADPDDVLADVGDRCVDKFEASCKVRCVQIKHLPTMEEMQKKLPTFDSKPHTNVI